MQLNLHPIISLPSVSAVNTKLLLVAEATSEMVMKTASGSHADQLLKQQQHNPPPQKKNAEFRVKHENTNERLHAWMFAIL